jgi:hypothetical protein
MDKARRKALLRQHRASEQESARRLLAFGEQQLRSLLDMLDEAAEHETCDHSARLTRAWAISHGLDPEAVIAAVQEFGGYCDCEVLANVTPDKFGWSD